MLVRGIGEATFAGLNPLQPLSRETTLTAKLKSDRGSKPPDRLLEPAPAAPRPKS